MKKFFKTCLIASGGIFLIGIIIVGICYFLGGTHLFVQEVINNGFTFPVNVLQTVKIADDDFVEHLELDDIDLSDFEFDDELESLDNSEARFVNEGKTDIAKKDEIKNIVVAIGASTIKLHRTPEDFYRIECKKNNTIKYYNEKGNLIILGVNENGYSNNTIQLYIPEETDLSNVSVKIGAGKATIEDIKCDTLNINVAAGKAEIMDVVTDQLQMEVEAGKAEFKGDIKENADVECAMGKVKLLLAGSREDWNFDMDAVAGDVSIENDTLNNASYSDQEADGLKNGKVECAMGKIEIRFKD